MQEAEDMELLGQYVRHNSEVAFAALVTRHVNLVYCAALRKTGNSLAAEEITQIVFILLAKKAARLRSGTVLSGWLYEAARLTSMSFLRTEIRRTRREKEACMQALNNKTEPDVWPQIAPMLEDAMGKLSEKERNAIMLRFFESKSFQTIGTIVGTSENAAKKRVSYGLEKLRAYFSKRGVVSTTTIIAGAISTNGIQAAPVALAKSVTAVAITKGAAAGSATLTLLNGTVKLMAWTKAKTAILLGAAALAVTTSSVVGIKLVQDQNESPGLSPTSMTQSYSISPDGSVRIQSTIEETNLTSRIIRTEVIGDLSAGAIVTDALGKSMKYRQAPGRGCLVTLNQPVPPAHGISFTINVSTGDLFKPNQSGDYELDMTQQQGNVQDMHLVEVWRLPADAILVTNSPAEFTLSTNGEGQIEVRLDKVRSADGHHTIVPSLSVRQSGELRPWQQPMTS